MQITLNDQPLELVEPQNLTAFLEAQGYAEMTVAIALNGTFVPKQEHANTNLKDGDVVDIVAPMQGG